MGIYHFWSEENIIEAVWQLLKTFFVCLSFVLQGRSNSSYFSIDGSSHQRYVTALVPGTWTKSTWHHPLRFGTNSFIALISSNDCNRKDSDIRVGTSSVRQCWLLMVLGPLHIVLLMKPPKKPRESIESSGPKQQRIRRARYEKCALTFSKSVRRRDLYNELWVVKKEEEQDVVL